jgi:hypothetical protein
MIVPTFTAAAAADEPSALTYIVLLETLIVRVVPSGPGVV